MSDPDPRRRACDELAELLSTPEGLRTARLLQLTEALDAPHGIATRRSEASPAGPQPISIWQPRQRGKDPTSPDGLTFVRPAPLPLGDHYSKRHSLDPAKPPGVARICFFGESAAAGYLYAPHLTPAECLERNLREATGKNDFEVIDLARTNETLESMVATLASSLQLDPDLLVLFTGNNWRLLETPWLSPYAPSVRHRQRYALALQRAGLAGPMDLAQRDLRRSVATAFDRIADLRRQHSFSVIVVVPEVNLADWEDRQPVAWLPGDGSARWHQGLAEALEHLDAGRYQAVLSAVTDLLALDEGRCPTTHRLQAAALTALKRPEEARRSCEAEVTAGHHATMAFLGSPRISVEEQQLLRREAARCDFSVVDLPRIFRDYTGEALPGRRLFLDYCHLTAEGIEVAMAAVTRETLKTRGLSSMLSHTPPPRAPPAVDALGKLGAAIHGAHRLLSISDKRAYLESWCREALVADPRVVDTMRDLLEIRCSPCPAVLTAAQQRQLESSHPLLLQHGWRWDSLDPEVITALCTVLEEAGHEVRGEVEERLLRSHAISPEGTDLSRPPYLWEPLERFYPEALARRGMTGRATFRSPWPTSRFCLISDAESDLSLEVTARLPVCETRPVHREDQLTVQVNGNEAATWRLREDWSRRTVVVPRSSLRRVINSVTLVWPLPPATGDLAIEHTISRLENGLEADLHPVFGEVFSLIARRP